MQTHSSRRTDIFNVEDAQGRVYTIVEYTDFIQAETFGRSEEVEGLKELRLSNGQHVNLLSEGEFQIVETGTKLRKVRR